MNNGTAINGRLALGGEMMYTGYSIIWREIGIWTVTTDFSIHMRIA
jgi:hypothetical protein